MNFLPVDARPRRRQRDAHGRRPRHPAAEPTTRAVRAQRRQRSSWASGPEHLDVGPDGPGRHAPGQRRRRGVPRQRGAHPRQRGGHDIVAVIGSEHRVKPGDELSLKVPLDKVHLFDPESTLALDKERAGRRHPRRRHRAPRGAQARRGLRFRAPRRGRPCRGHASVATPHGKASRGRPDDRGLQRGSVGSSCMNQRSTRR